jgi:Uma2 family endonuclease
MISVEEYLASSYEPDCDYVDGEVVERNVGETEHSWLQTALSSYLFVRRNEWNITPLVEQRVQIDPTRFRIPDVCVVLGPKPAERVLTKPPFLCVEILSPEDLWTRIEQRLTDYLEMGLPYAWVLDPQTKQAYIATATDGLREVKDGVLRTANPALEVPLTGIFA